MCTVLAHTVCSPFVQKKNAWRSHDYLLQFFYCDWQLWFCRAWGGKNNAQVYTSAGSFFAFFLPFLLENSYSDKARRDLDREPKAFTHKHMLTCAPVAACHWHILCCQSAAEAVDNSCHFTLVAPEWNSFIPLTDSCSPRWSSSEFTLPLSIPCCCALPLFFRDISRPMNSSPNCYSAVTNRLHSAGSGWRILQIKLDTETTENTDKENGPACCSDCLTSSRNLFSVNTAAAAAFGYVTLQWSAGINRSSSLLKMRGSALQQRT